MYSEDTLLRLIDQIYGASLEPAQWSVFLEALAEVIDGQVVNLAFTNVEQMATAMSFSARFDPAANRRYHVYYAALDPWANAAAQKGFFRTGVIALGAELLPLSEYQRTEFHNDFGRTCGLSSGISAVIRAELPISATLNASQRPNGRQFGDPELCLFQRLLPHLQRAFQVHERLNGLTQTRAAAEDVIDRLPFGVVFLDATERVLLVNRAAQQLFDAHDGLILRRNTVAAATNQQTAELHKCIAQAIAVSRGEAVEISTGGVLAVDRPSLKRPLQVLVTPIRTQKPVLTLSVAVPAAAIFVSDPENEPVTADAMLRAFYGLTPAESRLAAHLLQHRSVEEAAELLNISLNTARTHLKRLFEKTNSHRQSELLSLLRTPLGQL